MLRVLRHLEGIASVISRQKRNQNEGFSGSLLVIVHRDVVGFDLGHGSPSFRLAPNFPYIPEAKSYVSRSGKSMKPGNWRNVPEAFLETLPMRSPILITA
jgi:hypothetical protein